MFILSRDILFWEILMKGHHTWRDFIFANLGMLKYPGADPEFLQWGFICIKVWGFALLILSHFSSISYENEIIWSHLRPNYFIFIGYLKTGQGGGLREPVEPLQDPPLISSLHRLLYKISCL